MPHDTLLVIGYRIEITFPSSLQLIAMKPQKDGMLSLACSYSSWSKVGTIGARRAYCVEEGHLLIRFSLFC